MAAARAQAVRNRVVLTGRAGQRTQERLRQPVAHLVIDLVCGARQNMDHPRARPGQPRDR